MAQLLLLAVLSELIYLLIAFAGQSLHVEGVGHWSLLTILGLFATVFIVYLVALRCALHARQDRRLLLMIAVPAFAFRLTLLATDPIAEIDIYRYMWDGEACLQGVNPFRYSPAQVLAATDDARTPTDLGRLVQRRRQVPELGRILGHIHFGELPTIYPPTSQAVFVLASLTTPDDASVLRRMITFKAWFVLFDVMTFALVVLLLRAVGKPVGYSLAYGWCPLVIKEFANSGHLDAVAVFFTTLALYLAVRAFFLTTGSRSRGWLIAAALAFGFAIGAKFYPVVLVPLFLAMSLRRMRWHDTLLAGIVLLVTTTLILWPMIPTDKLVELRAFRFASSSESLPPLPPPYIGTEPRDPSESLRLFLSEWEMNDFIFLLPMENIRPTAQLPARDVAWFSVVPERWRAPVRHLTGRLTGVESSRTPFFFTRGITSFGLLILAMWLAWRAGSVRTAAAFLEAAFLTIAWFWLVLPTGNPWYWTWAVPLLPFARSKVWLALSGLVLLYYARFWLAFHYLDTPVLGTGYNGPLFFDYIVTWFEFAPWLAALAIVATWRRARTILVTRYEDPQVDSCNAADVL